MPKVFILTHVTKPETLRTGGTLIFETLRTGFPNAEVYVYDNMSTVDSSDIIHEIALDNDCEVSSVNLSLAPGAVCGAWIEKIISENEGEVVFVDPDVIFWENCEGWDFGDYSIAGRFIPSHYEHFSDAWIEPRLHTSFMWVKDCRRLWSIIKDLEKQHWGFSAFGQFVFLMNQTWQKYESGSSIYRVLPKTRHFTESQLNCYDHIGGGSICDEVIETLDPEARENYKEIIEHAGSDYTKLRGIWQMQENYYTCLR